MIKKIILGTVGFFIFTGVIGAIAGGGQKGEPSTAPTTEVKEEPQKPKEQEAPPSPMKISARDLADNFDANQVAAEDKWKDKLVEFSAEISNITDSGISFYNVASKEFSLTQISCKISDKQQLISLKNGQTITVQGVVKGQSLGVISINDCQVVKNNTPVTNTTSSIMPTSKPTPKTEEKTSSGVSME